MSMLSIIKPRPFGLICETEIEITEIGDSRATITVNLADFIDELHTNLTIMELITSLVIGHSTPEQLAAIIKAQFHPIDIERLQEALK